MRELAGRHLCRVDGLNADGPGVEMRDQIHAQTLRAFQERVDALIEDEEGRPLAALGRRLGIARRQRRLAASRGSHEQGAGAVVDAAAEEIVELLDARRQHLPVMLFAMFGGDETREDVEAARGDVEIVVAAAEALAAELGYP